MYLVDFTKNSLGCTHTILKVMRRDAIRRHTAKGYKLNRRDAVFLIFVLMYPTLL